MLISWPFWLKPFLCKPWVACALEEVQCVNHRRNLLKREGPCASRSSVRPTSFDSDCEPLVSSGWFAVLSSDSDEDGNLAESVQRASCHAIDCGRVAVAVSQVLRRSPKRLRLTSHNLGRMSQASTVVASIRCAALEYDLTRADSDHDTPLPMFPSPLPP